MQKTNSYSRLIQAIGCNGLVALGLFIVLFVSNSVLVLQSPGVFEKLETVIPQLNVRNVIIIGAAFATLFGLLINYNVLKVIFNLSIDDIRWQELLLLYVMSSLCANIARFCVKIFFKLDYFAEAVLVNSVYGLCIMLFANVFVWRNKNTWYVTQKLVLKLNVLLLLYVVINTIAAVLGASNNG